MALRFWAPLIGNLHNQGLDNVQLSGTTPDWTNDGKLGKAFISNGKTNSITIPSLNASVATTIGSTEQSGEIRRFTFAFWVRVLNTNTHANYSTTISLGLYTKSKSDYGNVETNSNFWLQRGTNSSTNSTTGLYWTYYNNSQIVYNSGAYTSTDAWTHLAITCDGSTFKYYKNGALVTTYTLSSYISQYRLRGGLSIGNANSQAYLNDVRIYDNCLSAIEVKELSKGLVAHYTLGSASLTSSGNLINGLSEGGQCTVSGNSINVSGTNSDTYFFIKTTKAMTSGKLYRLSCIGSGFPASALYNFPIASQSNTGPGQIKIKNGPCMLTFVANDTCANAGTNIIMDDTSRTAGAGTISGLCLEEISSVSDSSGYSRNLTITGNVSPADSVRYDKAIYIANQNINSNYLTSGSAWSPSFITTGSISFWCKFNGLGSSGWLPFVGQDGSHYVMAWNNSGNFYHRNAGSPSAIYRDGVVVSAPSDNGNWHHYCITGVNISSWTNFKVNQYGSSWDSNMYISDIRIYNTVLSADDVKDLYNLGALIS